MFGLELKSGLSLKSASMAFQVEVKSDDGVIEGYASKFGEIDRGGDMVIAGAYRASLAEKSASKVKMLWQHDPHTPIGIWESMQEDETGLRVKGRLLTSIQKGREALELLKAGVLDGLSIGYRTQDHGYVTEGGRTIRQLKKLDLWEVSLVTFPMLPSATVSAKAEDWRNPKFVEQYLREGGCSGSMAKAIANNGVKSAPREVGDGSAISDGMSDIFQSILKG